jgi:hypothetical protein
MIASTYRGKRHLSAYNQYMCVPINLFVSIVTASQTKSTTPVHIMQGINIKEKQNQVVFLRKNAHSMV